MPFSVRYHLRGNKTDNPAHLRTMALQFADRMLNPPVYPPLHSNRIRGAASNYLAECQSHCECDQLFPSSFPEEDRPRTGAPNSIRRVSQWLEDVEHARGNRPRTQYFPNPLLRENHRRAGSPATMQRVSQWLEDVERAGGNRPPTQQKSQRHGDKDAAKNVSAKLSRARDSVWSCLQSIRPTVEVVRERHAALLESLLNRRPMPLTYTVSGQPQWEIDWEDPANTENDELDYLASVVQSERFNDEESH